jgi:hypothetical protein
MNSVQPKPHLQTFIQVIGSDRRRDFVIESPDRPSPQL